MFRVGSTPVSGSSHPSFAVRKTFSREMFTRQKLRTSTRIENIYSRAQEAVSENLFEGILSAMHVYVRLDDLELARIPKTGPVLVVCNRPFGILDGAVLGAVLRRVRPDVKLLAHNVLRKITNLRENSAQSLNDCCFYVDPFGGRNSHSTNATSLLGCARWLRSRSSYR